ncbi:MAG: uracil-DNA glycosylase [Treponemataceae bacterium]
MTAEEKLKIASFLNIAEDYSRDGFHRVRTPSSFSDDAQSSAGAAASVESAATNDSLSNIAEEVKACSRCRLASGRTNAVPGEGVDHPLVMVIGEGPGADEDASGRPFVGKAGQLLDRMLSSIGLSRETNCFIANVVKCRPPQNRDPEADETAACSGFLDRQIALLRPKVILTVGRVPTQNILKTNEGIGRLRGKFVDFRGIPLLPTYHPSALLRDENLKRPAWEDLKLLRERLGGDLVNDRSV